MSLKILKSSSRNIDQCGTPADIFAHSLKHLFILQLESFFIKKSHKTYFVVI